MVNFVSLKCADGKSAIADTTQIGGSSLDGNDIVSVSDTRGPMPSVLFGCNDDETLIGGTRDDTPLGGGGHELRFGDARDAGGAHDRISRARGRP